MIRREPQHFQGVKVGHALILDEVFLEV